jgi:hypothetical protein
LEFIWDLVFGAWNLYRSGNNVIKELSPVGDQLANYLLQLRHDRQPEHHCPGLPVQDLPHDSGPPSGGSGDGRDSRWVDRWDCLENKIRKSVKGWKDESKI